MPAVAGFFARVHLLALLLLLAVGCAPTVQTVGPRTAAPQLGADGAFIAADATALPTRVWRPAGKHRERPRAIVLALHGFNDYSHAFDMPGRFWAEHGIATYAYDQRGFGAAPGRGIWAGTEAMVADLRDAAAALHAAFPDVPIYLLGESMGGAVVLTAMAKGGLPPGVRGAILAAPAVWARVTMPWYQRWALTLASWTLPWLDLTPPANLDIVPSDNIEVLRGLSRDPLVIKQTRVDAVRGLTDLMDTALAAGPALTVPSLVLYGENEQVIPREPVRRLLSDLPMGRGPRPAVYPQGWHLLLRDLNAETVWRDILTWIDDPPAPLPSGAEDHPWIADARDSRAPGPATLSRQAPVSRQTIIPRETAAAR